MSSAHDRARNQCYASCPASTVTIQPPPFLLAIPGPELYCPDQPLQIEQHNPCVVGPGRSSNRSLYASNFSSFYAPSLSNGNYSYCYNRSCYLAKKKEQSGKGGEQEAKAEQDAESITNSKSPPSPLEPTAASGF